jgi:hypothetical protein
VNSITPTIDRSFFVDLKKIINFVEICLILKVQNIIYCIFLRKKIESKSGESINYRFISAENSVSDWQWVSIFFLLALVCRKKLIKQFSPLCTFLYTFTENRKNIANIGKGWIRHVTYLLSISIKKNIVIRLLRKPHTESNKLK